MALPKAVVKRILTESGDGGLRVSGPALDLAVVAAEEYISRLATAALQSATENKRKTLLAADITNARARVG